MRLGDWEIGREGGEHNPAILASVAHMKISERVRRWLWYASWAAAGLWVARVAVLPAPLRSLRLSGVSGDGPYYAELSWDYGLGARPVSVIFDLEAGGAAGSCTADGEATEAEIAVGVWPGGPHRLTASATYRVLGVARTLVTRADGAA